MAASEQRRLMVTLAVIIGLGLACVSAKDRDGTPTFSQAATARCSEFRPDPQQPFGSANSTVVDADALELTTTDPADVGLDLEVLEMAADAVSLSPSATSLLLLRNGELAFERYFNGSGPTEANNVHSLSKSILSVLTGIAIDDGLLTLRTRIDEVLPIDQVPAHGDLTVLDLLTMSGGLDGPEVDLDYEWEPSTEPGEPSLVRAVLDRESVTAPGREFVYNTGLTHVLGAMVAEATGMSLCEFASDRLFGPLGIDADRWHVDPSGYFAGGYGLSLTPREIARFGQLVADAGMAGETQIVSSTWLHESVVERWELGCAASSNAQGYGYLWWLYDIGGHQVWLASGFGAQDLAIIEDLGLVAVIAHDTSVDGFRVPMLALLSDIVLAGVDDEPLPEPSDRCRAGPSTVATIAADGSFPPASTPGWPRGVLPWSQSPDGERLAFSRRYAGAIDLYTIERDGSAVSRITQDGEPDLMPSWSPDGSVIAFARGEPSNLDLYLVTPDGTHPRQLTSWYGYEHSPTWSPDSRRIAFVRGHDRTNGFGGPGELWVIDADGSDATRLTSGDVSFPAWSPDGTRIAYSLDNGELVVHDLATDSITRLGEGLAAAWSPDGTRIAYVAFDNSDLADDTTKGLFTIAADGTDRQRLTNGDSFDTLPLWSPDSTQILFSTEE